MSIPNALPDGGNASARENIFCAQRLLKEALALLDQSPASPAIGARLEEIIDTLDEQFSNDEGPE